MLLHFGILFYCTLFSVHTNPVYGQSTTEKHTGIFRQKCANRVGISILPVSIYRQRLRDLRKEMQIRASVQGSEIDAYIITSYDEHQSEFVAEEDKRRQYLTGFNGTNGDAAVTMTKCAIWTDERFLQQADAEMDCEWQIFKMGDNPTLSQWLASELSPDSKVGADPHLVPHYLWQEMEYELSLEYIRLMKINRNLIDSIWGTDRPTPHNDIIKIQPLVYAGEKWEDKVTKMRNNMTALRVDAIVVTSLTEVAYLFNLRGNDIPFVPVFKAYAIVTLQEIFLYINQSRIDLGVALHLKADPCHHANCIQLRDYAAIWRDLRTFSQQWKRVLVPSFCVYDMGASEAIYSSLPKESVVLRVSPIIYMRAQKNSVERAGMFTAHVRDAAALCDVFSYFEEKYIMGDHWTEMKLSQEIDLTRRSQKLSHDISFETVVAFGEHGALTHYTPNNLTDAEITEASTLLIDSGGQYVDGTTEVARTLHLGTPTAEQKRTYTLVLAAMIKLSMLVFPENIKLSEVDILPRGIMWGDLNDYPHGTGHGIGSYLSVRESPINIAYTAKHRYTFKDGYFFSNQPGYYKAKDYGIKLKNVLEVYDTGKVHPSGRTFLAFRDVTLVPFEPKLIDRALLSSQEKRWLNEYNARIREFVGEELKKQTKMQAFYWMMNKTKHIIEYLPEEEYRNKNTATSNLCDKLILFITITIMYIFV